VNQGQFAFLKPSNYPIWLKIALVVAIGLVAFGLPAFLTVRAATLESGYENAQRYLELSSAQRAASLRGIVEGARAALQNAIDEPRVRQDLLVFLVSEAQATPTDVTGDDIGDLLQARLLNPATTQFTSLRFINSIGLVIAARAVPGEDISGQVGTLQINTPAFRAGVAAVAAGGSSTVVVIEGSQGPQIEVITAIKRRGGEWIGFVIGRLNATVIQSSLSSSSADYPISSFLISDQQTLITPLTLPEGAVTPSVSPGGARALEGQTGIAQYTLPNGESVVGYYAPISAGRLGFVSEISLAAIESQSIRYFTARAFSLLVAFVALGGLMLALVLVLNQQLTPPLKRLRSVTQALGKGDFSPAVPDSARGDEIGALASSFVMMRDQVQMLVGELQERLDARARDIDTTQEISRYAATQRDLQSLLDRVCVLLTERFENIYHAQVFLLDDERRNAILQASTGDAGAELLRRGHRLAVGGISLVGQAVEQKRMTLARDTESASIFHPNPLLPDTRAELALPLLFRDTVIGVLDVQSRLVDAFPDEQISVLQTVANQIAVGIQSAQLYEQSVRRLETIEEANRQVTLRAWQDYMRAQRVRELRASAGQLPEGEKSDLRQAVFTTGRPVIGALTERQTLPVAIPIASGGQPIGIMEWEVPAHDFDENTLELAQELAKRLANSLENARLFHESRRAAERERMVNTIAARLTAQTNVEEILQTAVREVGQALRTPQVSIRLHGADAPENGSSNGNGHHP
jgi:GAF domain-containing protein/HAMP domain-containing protein